MPRVVANPRLSSQTATLCILSSCSALSSLRSFPGVENWPAVTQMRPSRPRYAENTQIRSDAPGCVQMRPDAPRYIQIRPERPDAPRYAQIRPDMPKYSQKRLDAPRCAPIHSDTLRRALIPQMPAVRKVRYDSGAKRPLRQRRETSATKATPTVRYDSGVKVRKS